MLRAIALCEQLVAYRAPEKGTFNVPPSIDQWKSLEINLIWQQMKTSSIKSLLEDTAVNLYFDGSSINLNEYEDYKFDMSHESILVLRKSSFKGGSQLLFISKNDENTRIQFMNIKTQQLHEFPLEYYMNMKKKFKNKYVKFESCLSDLLMKLMILKSIQVALYLDEFEIIEENLVEICFETWPKRRKS